MTDSTSKKTISSKVVFFWIGAALILMFAFMMVCKEMGVLNPRKNWEMEFIQLSEILIDTHKEAIQSYTASSKLSSSNLEEILKKYAGNQLRLRKDSLLQPISGVKKYLNKKQLSIISFAASKQNGSKGKVFSFAIFPIAKRQLAKTYMFTQGSFLWHAYSWQTGPISMKVESETKQPDPNQLNVVAANYMNDYFIFVVGAQSHRGLVKDLYSTLSLYESDFIKTL